MPLFISTGHIAKARLKQVMTFEFDQSAIEDALATGQNFNHGTLQIVVGQLNGDSVQILKEMIVGIDKARHVILGVRSHERGFAERKSRTKEKENRGMTVEDDGSLAPIDLDFKARGIIHWCKYGSGNRLLSTV